jgi:hypothetical protein
MALVFNAQGLNSSETLLLLAYTNFTDAHGFCHPGMQRLQDMTAMSYTTVWRARQSLENKNLLKHQKRRKANGEANSNKYRVNLKQLQAMQRPPREYEDNFEGMEFEDSPADTVLPAVLQNESELSTGKNQPFKMKGTTFQNERTNLSKCNDQPFILKDNPLDNPLEDPSLSLSVVTSRDVRASAEREKENSLEEEKPEPVGELVSSTASLPVGDALGEQRRALAVQIVHDLGTDGAMSTARGAARGHLIDLVHDAIEADYDPTMLAAYLGRTVVSAQSLSYIVGALTPERLRNAIKPPHPINHTGGEVSGPCGHCQAPKYGIEEPGERVYRLPEAPTVEIPCPECNPSSSEYGTGTLVPMSALHRQPPRRALIDAARKAIQGTAQQKPATPAAHKRSLVDEIETPTERAARERALAALATRLETAA